MSSVISYSSNLQLGCPSANARDPRPGGACSDQQLTRRAPNPTSHAFRLPLVDDVGDPVERAFPLLGRPLHDHGDLAVFVRHDGLGEVVDVLAGHVRVEGTLDPARHGRHGMDDVSDPDVRQAEGDRAARHHGFDDEGAFALSNKLRERQTEGQLGGDDLKVGIRTNAPCHLDAGALARGRRQDDARGFAIELQCAGPRHEALAPHAPRRRRRACARACAREARREEGAWQAQARQQRPKADPSEGALSPAQGHRL
mmetsp:Transcript_111000/g.353684  ORF Transcript_111000/g.353684 Transcript_111000/m.353684 type:complete len:256 (+) Transcript_111000:79-846(+)